MVFATPQPLPGTIHDNLVYGPRLAGVRAQLALAGLVEESLRAAQLWDEVKDDSANPRSRSPAGSNSACAWRGPSRSAPRSCSSMSRARASIRSRR